MIRRAAIVLGLVCAVLSPVVASADTYRVQPGDTLSSIAGQLDISVDLLLLLNSDIESPDQVFVGQLLTVPDQDSQTVSPSAVRVVHTVQPGDTLSALASLYGVTQAAILALNPGLDPDLLIVGTSIVIRDDSAAAPTAAPTADPAAERWPYVVQPGDTFSGLAARFGVSLDHLLALNPDIPPDRLLVGDTIFVPAGDSAGDSVAPPQEPSGPATVDYVVQPGDTYSGIAARFGLSTAELLALNPETPPNRLLAGGVIRVPAASPLETPIDAPVVAPEPEPDLTIYVVVAGDTAYAIAATFGLSLTELAALNPSIDLNLLPVGQTLVVPDVAAVLGWAPAQDPSAALYVVQPGDTLSGLAESAGISVEALLALNPSLDADLLPVGAEIVLPGVQSVPSASTTVTIEVGDSLEYLAARLGVLPHTLLANNPHIAGSGFIPAGTALVIPNREGVLVTVQPGDTLSAIAERNGTTVEAILADPRNGVSDANRLIIGQELIVPIAVPPFIWPVQGDITDTFGVCRASDCSIRHHGLDISQRNNPGGPVLAAAGGVVTFVGGTYCCGLGLYVEIDHGGGWKSRYAHLSQIDVVVEGQVVAQGEVIGNTGCTGWCTGVHLHLELEHNGWLLDARNYLP